MCFPHKSSPTESYKTIKHTALVLLLLLQLFLPCFLPGCGFLVFVTTLLPVSTCTHICYIFPPPSSLFCYLPLSLPLSPSVPASLFHSLSFSSLSLPQDISAHKSSRTAPAIPPPLGPSPPSSLLAYPHEYSAGPHHRLYTMMRPGAISIPPQMTQPIQSAKPCLTNDMGPPIFMPCMYMYMYCNIW